MKKYTENQIIEVVNTLLNQVDMCDLICDTEQENEYINEARVIAGFVNEKISKEKLASICVDVFEEYFPYSFEQGDFIQVAEFILLNLYE